MIFMGFREFQGDLYRRASAHHRIAGYVGDGIASLTNVSAMLSLPHLGGGKVRW